MWAFHLPVRPRLRTLRATVWNVLVCFHLSSPTRRQTSSGVLPVNSINPRYRVLPVNSINPRYREPQGNLRIRFHVYLLNKFITMGSHLKVLNTEVTASCLSFRKIKRVTCTSNVWAESRMVQEGLENGAREEHSKPRRSMRVQWGE